MKRPLIILAAVLPVFLWSCGGGIELSGEIDSRPAVFPDYSDVTVPCNIAPLNFRCDAPSGKTALILSSGDVTVCIKGPEFDIPIRKWRTLTATGEDIRAQVCVREEDGWKGLKPFVIHVSADKIDPFVAYRLIPPGYETWYRMGLYQRNLETFEQTPIITNDKTGDNCMNCHSFCNRNPDRMMFHMRAVNGGTYTWMDGKIEKLNTKTPKTISALVYPRWHPGGRFIAFSVNDIAQFFHTTNRNRIEVYDSVSDVVMYDTRNHEVFTTGLITDSTRFETFPAFSADGRKLFFCSSPAQKVPGGYKDIRYSICSIDFDAENKSFGTKVDTVYSAWKSGRGATLPRVSPDGRFLLFTETDYGCFGIWHHDSDLHVIDLRTGADISLDGANSDDTESYHCWSSNGRWIIYASRRLDGLYSRLYISHIDEDGFASKAFLLPQKNSRHYSRQLESYNVPEFITGKVGFNMDEMAEVARKDPGINVSFAE